MLGKHVGKSILLIKSLNIYLFIVIIQTILKKLKDKTFFCFASRLFFSKYGPQSDTNKLM